MPVLLQLPLEIPEVEVLSPEFCSEGALLINVDSTRQGTRWGRCGRAIQHFHGDDRPIPVRHLPLRERRVYLEIRPKRYRCRHGEGRPTTTPCWDGDDPTSPPTQAVEKGVVRCRVNSTVADVSCKLGLGPDAMEGLLGRWVATPVDWSPLTPLETLGIEAMALPRGPGNDVAVLSPRDAPGQGVLFAVWPARLKATVTALLESIPAPLTAPIPPGCTDRDAGYVNAGYEALPGVPGVVDRFHGAQRYPDRVDPLRQQERKRLHQELPAAEDEPLKGLRWIVRQDWTRLSEADQTRVLPVFHPSPALEQADCLRPVLTGICNSPCTHARATAASVGWDAPGRASGLRCFEGFRTTVANWREEMTNDVLQRQHSGFGEGRNNKLKVLKRHW